MCGGSGVVSCAERGEGVVSERGGMFGCTMLPVMQFVGRLSEMVILPFFKGSASLVAIF